MPYADPLLPIGRSPEKKLPFFRILPNFLFPPPTSPKFGRLVQLFSDVEIQDLKDSLLYYILYNLKKQLKVQIIGILE